jgi:hypothetical protein
MDLSAHDKAIPKPINIANGSHDELLQTMANIEVSPLVSDAPQSQQQVSLQPLHAIAEINRQKGMRMNLLQGLQYSVARIHHQRTVSDPTLLTPDDVEDVNQLIADKAPRSSKVCVCCCHAKTDEWCIDDPKCHVPSKATTGDPEVSHRSTQIRLQGIGRKDQA